MPLKGTQRKAKRDAFWSSLQTESSEYKNIENAINISLKVNFIFALSDDAVGARQDKPHTCTSVNFGAHRIQLRKQ